jgi:hypothetical protein
MRFKNPLATLLAASVLTFSGCDRNPEPKYTTITGRPISLGESSGNWGGEVSVYVQVGKEQVLACTNWIGKYETGSDCLQAAAKAQALVNSEIAKGDFGRVELTGNYDSASNIQFKINSVRVGRFNIGPNK